MSHDQMDQFHIRFSLPGSVMTRISSEIIDDTEGRISFHDQKPDHINLCVAARHVNDAFPEAIATVHVEFLLDVKLPKKV